MINCLDPISEPYPSIYRRGGKRVVDVTLAFILSLVALPLLLTVALALRLSLGPGIILSQQRIGRNGKAFALYKFRTMRPDQRRHSAAFDGPDRRCRHKSDNDPRHTPLGRVVRKFSLDELPQLTNIYRGDMSLVGPRPELKDVATDDFLRHERHRVRPGLTGPFQVSDLRFNGDLRAGLDLDAGYVERVSLRSDVVWLASTVKVLVRGTGS